jgi:hypothetical protein
MKMKTQQLNFKILVLSVLAIALALFASVMLAPTGIASADSGTPTPTAKGGEKANEVLEKFYEREVKMLAEQDKQLVKANDVASKAQDYIDEQKANGKDVTKLPAALGRMKAQIAKAQSAHDQATSILNRHAGFDANGKVTNAAPARQTIAKSRGPLNQAHDILRKVTQEFVRLLNNHREANGGDSAWEQYATTQTILGIACPAWLGGHCFADRV